MQYRPFGKTGVNISALGFGAMRLPTLEGEKTLDEEKSLAVLRRAYELGVNYFDTAHGYCDGQSQYMVGKALKGIRDKVYLSTKLPLWDVKETKDYFGILEEQLRRLDTDYIDFYHFHGIGRERWENTILKLNLLKEAEKAKAQGLIKHISFSFHDEPEFLKELVDVGIFETLLCQYNLLDRKNEEAIAYANEKGVGTVIMGPVGGGRLAAPSETFGKIFGESSTATPEVAMRFVLGNQTVSCALSGMSTIEMVEQNAKIASLENPLDKETWTKVTEAIEQTKRLSELYCTGCDYCMPCPQGIKIPRLFQMLNYHRVYGLTDYAKAEYKKVGNSEHHGAVPSACVECGQCEAACPQKIKIIENLKVVHEQLA